MSDDTPLPPTIGPYRVVRLIGKGGMGVVYEGIHETIARRVAIKVLNADHAKRPEAMQRFFNEARSVNLIEHPSLVQISDFGQLPDGTAYLVMELLRGESLDARLARVRRPPLLQTLQVAWQVADALVAAHASGIVHRDLKPDNLMLVPDSVAPGGERVKILDFGIAKLVEIDKSATQSSALLGTPRYMSPEQCRGAGMVDERTDVYSLGVILYQMLAGETPFDGQFGELISAHLVIEPPPLAPLCKDIPPEVCRFVHSLLVKNREQRPRMDAVRTALGHFRAASGSGVHPVLLLPPPAQASGPHKPAAQTTLGTANGQSAGTRRTGPLIGAAVATIGVFGIGAMWLSRSNSAGRDAPQGAAGQGAGSKPAAGSGAAAATPALVRWSLDSQPSGADVIDEAGHVLGKTPWAKEGPSSSGALTVKLQLAGYREQSVSLRRDKSETRSEPLQKVRARPIGKAQKRPAVQKKGVLDDVD